MSQAKSGGFIADRMDQMAETICGFTIKKIDAATCYLTYKGMQELNPCGWALDWMRNRKVVKVTPRLFSLWKEQAPQIWLFSQYGQGPCDGWPWNLYWRNEVSECYYFTQDDLVKMSRYLKAYIMKHGEPGRR